MDISRLIEIESAKITRESAYAVYDNWIRRQNQHPISQMKFSREVVIQKPTMNLLDSTMFSDVQIKPGLATGYMAQGQVWGE